MSGVTTTEAPTQHRSMHPLTIVVALQPRRIDLNQPPWSRAMEAMVTEGAAGARRVLHDIAEQERDPGTRSYAMLWSGRLALREQDLAGADADFTLAMGIAP